MFTFRKNEEGYALLVVLFTITIISLFGLGLMGSALNSASQSQLTEKKIQQEDLAEMGMSAFRNKLENVVPTLTKDRTVGLGELRERLPILDWNNSSKQPPIEQNLPSSGNTTYKLTAGYTEILEQNDDVLITYKSIGTVNGDAFEKLETIKLAFGSSGGTDFSELDPDTNPDHYEKKYNKKSDSHFRSDETIDGNALFNENLKVNKSNKVTVNGDVALQDGTHMANDGTIIINGNLYAKDGKLFLNSGSYMEVTGDALFGESLTVQIPTNSAICIRGSLQWENPTIPIQTADTCASATNGLYVLNESTSGGSGDGDWDIIGSSQ